MTTFVLVHGAWHGAWCWEPLIQQLGRRGRAAVAVDLPCGDPTAGCAAYAEIIAGQIAHLSGDVVLVGHSLGGLTIPLVAATRPVRRLVYLCALIPSPGESLIDQVAVEPSIFCPGWGSGIVRDAEGRSYWEDEEAAVAALFADCPPDEARGLVRRLRPQARLPSTEPCPLDALPVVDSVSIVGRDDAAISPDWSRRAARDRLGVEAVELPGGHSPFAARPGALAEVLLAP